MPTKDLSNLTHLISDEGIAVVILACVVFLGFFYFWKMIQRKTAQEKSCELHGNILHDILRKLQELREDTIEIKIRIAGKFRNQGDDD